MYGGKSPVLKILIYASNFVIFICGAIILGLGIWSAVEDTGLMALLSRVMLSGVYILIASGALVMLVSFLGCYGCHNRNKPAIVIFSTLALIAAALKTIGCIILYVYYVDSTTFLSESYKTEYEVKGFEKITRTWDQAQIEGKCCGLRNYRDWEDSEYFNVSGRYPPSCCVASSEDKYTALDEEKCRFHENGFIYERGCEPALRTYYYAVGCTTIVVIIIELVAVILLVMFYQRIP